MMPMLLLQPVQMPPPRQVLGSGAAARAAMRLQPQLPTPARSTCPFRASITSGISNTKRNAKLPTD